VTEAEFRYLREQWGHCARLDEIDLPCDELGQRFAVDPVLRFSSLRFTSVNPEEVPTRRLAPPRSTLRVALCLTKG
jgi:hypothetical protein